MQRHFIQQASNGQILFQGTFSECLDIKARLMTRSVAEIARALGTTTGFASGVNGIFNVVDDSDLPTYIDARRPGYVYEAYHVPTGQNMIVFRVAYNKENNPVMAIVGPNDWRKIDHFTNWQAVRPLSKMEKQLYYPITKGKNK